MAGIEPVPSVRIDYFTYPLPSTIPFPLPSMVMAAGISATAIALGFFHTCALVANGGVKCWGRNDNGQLGIGSFSDQPWPVDVAGGGCAPSRHTPQTRTPH